MKRSRLFLSLLLCFVSGLCFGQFTKLKFNLDFEGTYNNQFPDGWMKWGTSDYSVILDSVQVHSGKFSALISPQPEAGSKSFGAVAYPLDVNSSAKNVTLEAFMKIEDVKDGFAGLVLRIDGGGKTLREDNMQSRKIQGSHDWKKYSITLPFPAGAEKIYVAGILVGKGKAWFDSFEVLIDGKRIQEIPK